MAIADAVEEVTISDLNGRVVERVQDVRNGLLVVPSTLALGVYVLACTDATGMRHSARVVVQ
jgi:hypothetical protein